MTNSLLVKQIIFVLISLIVCNGVHSQKLDSTKLSVEQKQLLSKSRGQKTAGLIILGTGLPVALVTGFLIASTSEEDWEESTGTAVFVGSLAYTLVSIPLLSAGRRNKQKALSISMSKNRIMLPGVNTMSFRMQPAISLNIPFN